ncbi:MAG: DUF4349 domain-containing protein [Haloferacaceae archaeon]
MRTRTLAVVGIALLVVLAGCGGSGSAPVSSGGSGAPSAGGGGGAPDKATGAPTNDAGGGSSDGGGSGEMVVEARIRTGEMTLRVEDYDAARSKLSTLAESHGGYVSDSGEQTHSRANATWTTGHLVLRVPSEDFSTVFEAAKRRGAVVSSSTSSTVVTDQLVDIEARLSNLRAQRARLRALYDRANDTEAILRIDGKLTEVQGEIERLEARKRALEDRVDYATITVELREDQPEPEPAPGPERWYDTGVLAAFLESVSGVATVLRALVVGLAYVAPYVLVFSAPLVALLALYRWRRGL